MLGTRGLSKAEEEEEEEISVGLALSVGLGGLSVLLPPLHSLGRACRALQGFAGLSRA